jgi:hypothetical protein
MIYPEFDVDEIIDAQLICRLWHATDFSERAKMKAFDPSVIRAGIRQVIEVLDPQTFTEIFSPTL